MKHSQDQNMTTTQYIKEQITLGISITQIAKSLKIGKSTIYKLMRANNLQSDRVPRITSPQLDEAERQQRIANFDDSQLPQDAKAIYNLLCKDTSLSTISKQLGIPRTTVRYKITKFNLDIFRKNAGYSYQEPKEKIEHHCVHCDYSNPKKWLVTRHAKQVHEKADQVVCDICGNTLSTKDKLNRHIALVHQKQGQVQCPRCEAILSDATKLKRHIEQVHEQLKRVKCQECGEKLADNTKLNRHMERFHNNRQSYTCTIEGCSKTFKTKEDRQVHVKYTHSDVRDWDCDMDGCESQPFKTSGKLRRHLRTVHSELRPYECPFKCDSWFKSPDEVKQHLVMHSDLREFVCKLCGHKSKRKRDLTNHYYSVHSNEKRKECPYCDFSAFYLSNLKNHVNRHSKDRPFKCNNCNYDTPSQFDLHTHVTNNRCWYDFTQEKIWEDICKEIAKLLFIDQNWEWHPRIKTPQFENKNYILPEIVIYDKNGNIDTIIDAKRSSGSTTPKDINIYPKVARKVEFWALFGKPSSKKNRKMIISDQIIQKLQEKEEDSNTEQIEDIIERINELKSYNDYKNKENFTQKKQTKLDELSKNY